MKKTCIGTAVALALGIVSLPTFAQNVKITPVGSHPGELRSARPPVTS